MSHVVLIPPGQHPTANPHPCSSSARPGVERGRSRGGGARSCPVMSTRIERTAQFRFTANSSSTSSWQCGPIPNADVSSAQTQNHSAGDGTEPDASAEAAERRGGQPGRRASRSTRVVSQRERPIFRVCHSQARHGQPASMQADDTPGSVGFRSGWRGADGCDAADVPGRASLFARQRDICESARWMCVRRR